MPPPLPRCLRLPVIVAMLLAQASSQKTGRTPLERLQAKIDVVAVPILAPRELAGQYTNPSEELRKHIVPMGSENLFLFPDETYIFTHVSDIPPETISDKGTWSLNGGTLRLESDKDVIWKAKWVERRHVIVRRRGHSNEIFLVGIDWSLQYFEQQAKSDPQTMLLVVSLKREKIISAADAEPIRAKLMKEMWDPGFYR